MSQTIQQQQQVIESVTGYGARYIATIGWTVTTGRRAISIQKISEQLSAAGLHITTVTVNDGGTLTVGISRD